MHAKWVLISSIAILALSMWLLVDSWQGSTFIGRLSPANFCSGTSVGLAIGMFVGVCTPSNPNSLKVSSGLKVFGAGLPRTGTDSLRQSLEDLGYKTYHMKNFIQNCPQHLQSWKPGNASSMDAVFDVLQRDGYTATVDFPIAPFWADALKRYPDAKVILTVRDNGKRWIESFRSLIANVGHLFCENTVLTRLRPWLVDFRELHSWLMTRIPGLSDGDCFLEFAPCGASQEVFVDDEKCIGAYDRYIERVQREVPSAQLLVFNVKEGYAPLCTFLGISSAECPTDFPHVNSRMELFLLGTFLGFLRFGLVPLLVILVAGFGILFLGVFGGLKGTRTRRAVLKDS